MRITLPHFAAVLQTLFTTTAEQAARATGLIQRRRRVSGARFVQALVFGWMDDPQATLDDLAADLGVSEQALQKKVNPAAVACLRQVLAELLTHLLTARGEALPLLRRFRGVSIEDGTSVPLPAELADAYPGCGGSDPQVGQAGLKLLVRFDAASGGLQNLVVAPARQSERTLVAQLPPCEAGSLRLADLGFFDLQRLAQDTAAGVFWISRLPAQVHVDGQELARWLSHRHADRIDTSVHLGTRHRLGARLVAWRVPTAGAEVRLRRLRKKLSKKGRTLSERQRLLCRWTVLITNLDASEISAEQIESLYRVRWQIELLFRRWKSGGGLARSRGRTGCRVLCEIYAKLMGLIVTQWAVLLRGGPLGPVSMVRAARRIRRWAARLGEALATRDTGRLRAVLQHLHTELWRLPNRPQRHKPTTRQRLLGITLVA